MTHPPLPPVLSVQPWATNAELICDIARLGYLRKEDSVLDPTYGQGNWWTLWRPAKLVHHDLRYDGTDFRQLPHEDDSFDAVAYDPPYVAKGGRTTSTTVKMNHAYGMDDAPATPALLQQLINDGLAECLRVLKPKGIMLVKCQDYISSGRYWPGEVLTQNRATALGMRMEDKFIHYTPYPRAQPRFYACRACEGEGRVGFDLPDGVTLFRLCRDCDGAGKLPRRQVHSHRNMSTMLVLRKAPVVRRRRSQADPEALTQAGGANGHQVQREPERRLGVVLGEEERRALAPVPDRMQDDRPQGLPPHVEGAEGADDPGDPGGSDPDAPARPRRALVRGAGGGRPDGDPR